MTSTTAQAEQDLVRALAVRVRDEGAKIGLPYIAVSADIGDPQPMLGADGRPFAETLFEWLDPGLHYWKDRGFALRSPFVFGARYTAEPFFFVDGRFGTWRPAPRLERIEVLQAPERLAVGTAIIAPAHLPGGIIGAVVWASPEVFDVRPTFEREAAGLHALTLKMLAAYNDLGVAADSDEVRLTRREIQCLKWAADGKTDADIGQIMKISTPTVRFHMRNAADKMGVTGRPQAVHHATTLGYIGERKSRSRA
jgi:DNA-binding CsgD family transcriptional regulator